MTQNIHAVTVALTRLRYLQTTPLNLASLYYVTRFVKTYIVHTSKFSTLKIHKICYDRTETDVYREKFFISHIMTPHIHNMNIYHDIATSV